MVDFPLERVKEGQTAVLVPDVEAFRKSPDSFPPSDAPVFYNKKMEINRDFALAVLRVYLEKFQKNNELLFCEPMAGSGVRAVRVVNELPIFKVIINDLNPYARELIEENITQLGLSEKVEIYQQDANALMLHFASQGRKFDALDIDPFGSPAPFIDAAAQAMNNDGLLAVTSTDMATMCGVYPEACIRKYASQPIHSFIAHEFSVRMQYGFIATLLARHEKGMDPLFAHSTEHFIRTYCLSKKGITTAKNTLKEIGYVAQCLNCFYLETQKGNINLLDGVCPLCGKKRLLGGPIWLGLLYNQGVVENLITNVKNNALYGTNKRMMKLLVMIKDELEIEQADQQAIFFYDLHRISDKLSIPTPNFDLLMETLRSQGYLVARSHFRLTAIKTNSPLENLMKTIKGQD